MAQAYSEQQIEYALSTLEYFECNFKEAAAFLHIPAKTLKSWEQQRKAMYDLAAWRADAVANLKRPMPPDEVLDPYNPEPVFLPAHDVEEWLKLTFVAPGAILENEDHIHLLTARIGVQWTNVALTQKMKKVVGTAEIPRVQGNQWTKARVEYHLSQMFGFVPELLITLYAPYAQRVNNAGFCSLIEHEMYHCAQAIDQFGDPKINEEGLPIFTMRGHDAEEFVGIVKRYGVGAAAGGVKELVDASKQPPSVALADINIACGTCLR